MRTARVAAWGIAVAALCFAAREARLSLVQQYRAAQRYEDVYYLPRAQYLPLLSLGYRAALADLLWCKSLVYFGEEVVHQGVVRYLFQYTDAILALDPSFREPYRWVPTGALYRPGSISRDDALHAADYLVRAVRRWPDDGELRWDYGSLLRFELAPMERDPKRKRALLERAAPQLEAAARLGAGPAWLALNSAELLDKLGRTEQAIHHLEELRERVGDPAMQAEIDHKLELLRTHIYLETLKAAERQFEGAGQRRYPRLSPGQFPFVAEPAAPWADEGFVSDGQGKAP